MNLEIIKDDFQAIWDDKKTFVIVPFANGRRFVGDMMLFAEIANYQRVTGRTIEAEITFLSHSEDGLLRGWTVVNFKVLARTDNE